MKSSLYFSWIDFYSLFRLNCEFDLMEILFSRKLHSVRSMCGNYVITIRAFYWSFLSFSSLVEFLLFWEVKRDLVFDVHPIVCTFFVILLKWCPWFQNSSPAWKAHNLQKHSLQNQHLPKIKIQASSAWTNPLKIDKSASETKNLTL